MSEEVLQAAGDLNFWRKRAEQAEAFARTLQTQRDAAEQNAADLRAALAQAESDAAALRGAAEIVRSEYNKLLESPLPDVYAVMQWLRWPVGHLAVTAEIHKSGAALLAELEAAREIVEALRAHWHCGGEVWRSIDRDFEAYDAAVKARTR